MAAYNFRLHGMVIDALTQFIEDEKEYLVNDRDSDIGKLRHRIGRIDGLREAIMIAEQTRKKAQES